MPWRSGTMEWKSHWLMAEESALGRKHDRVRLNMNLLTPSELCNSYRVPFNQIGQTVSSSQLPYRMIHWV